MGRTALGESMPYCVGCSDYVGNLKDKFGSLCPRCGNPTVDYDAWKRRLMDEFLSGIRDGRRKLKKESRDEAA